MVTMETTDTDPWTTEALIKNGLFYTIRQYSREKKKKNRYPPQKNWNVLEAPRQIWQHLLKPKRKLFQMNPIFTSF